MSAAEVKTFLHFLPLIIGHKIPEGNTAWKLITTLVDISDDIMRNDFDENSINCLREKIKSYLKLYIEIFGANLRPKHHFMLHYPDCIQNNGPLR